MALFRLRRQYFIVLPRELFVQRRPRCETVILNYCTTMHHLSRTAGKTDKCAYVNTRASSSFENVKDNGSIKQFNYVFIVPFRSDEFQEVKEGEAERGNKSESVKRDEKLELICYNVEHSDSWRCSAIVW